MEEIWMKVLLTVVGALTASLIGWLGFQIKKYRGLIKKEEDETDKVFQTDRRKTPPWQYWIRGCFPYGAG